MDVPVDAATTKEVCVLLVLNFNGHLASCHPWLHASLQLSPPLYAGCLQGLFKALTPVHTSFSWDQLFESQTMYESSFACKSDASGRLRFRDKNQFAKESRRGLCERPLGRVRHKDILGAWLD